jgi:hypothetical protein
MVRRGDDETTRRRGDEALAVWLDRLASQASTTTTLEVAISGGQVSLTPAGETEQVLVRGNEIIIGKRRIVLHPVAGANIRR